MFGLSKIVHDQLKSGDTYKNIKRAISILITDFVLIEENDSYYNRFRFYDERTKTEFSKMMEINTLELAKLPSELMTKVLKISGYGYDF
ncbi:hypothetical protein FACS189465_0330 [Clostridia bacterium]|nr:hypothetical protein FACS189465_0330 [Clostridia bacterium]